MFKLSSFSSSTRSQSFSSTTCMEKYVMHGDKTRAMSDTRVKSIKVPQKVKVKVMSKKVVSFSGENKQG